MNDDEILIIDPTQDLEVLRGLASETRVKILGLIHARARNINEITELLELPQSTVSANIAILEKTGLIRTENSRGKKGTQKVCHPVYNELVIRFSTKEKSRQDNVIEVEMPVGLYTSYHVSAPCGLCSIDGIIGYLDVPSYFLDPGRVRAGLVWFEKGFVEYKFPNNSLYKDKPLKKLEISAELSSETPGTNKNWLSDITLTVNGVEIGNWTSPGDFGDRRGKLTPDWWKLEGSQYGLLKNWSVTEEGAFVDGVAISEAKLSDLLIPEHHSVRVRFGVKENAEHPGGLNIFGKGFGNYDQDIIMRLYF